MNNEKYFELLWNKIQEGFKKHDERFTSIQLIYIDVIIRTSMREILAGSDSDRQATSGKDVAAGHVESLTEAVMGLTASGKEIASAINNIAEAIRETAA